MCVHGLLKGLCKTCSGVLKLCPICVLGFCGCVQAVFRGRSRGVRSVFRVCSGCSQGVFRVCSGQARSISANFDFSQFFFKAASDPVLRSGEGSRAAVGADGDTPASHDVLRCFQGPGEKD